ncbi:hypothetical protein D3C78_1935740 [compost metagenome]
MKRPHEVGRGRLVAMSKLIEDARFGERERALVEMGVQQAKAVGIEPVEGAQRRHVGVVVSECHRGDPALS